MKKNLLLALFVSLCLISVRAQEIPASFADFEKSFRVKFDSARALDTDSSLLTAMKSLQDSLVFFLANPLSYSYPFDSLKSVGKVNSPDNEFRLITWNVELTTDAFRNYCIIQKKPGKNSECPVIVLEDNTHIDSVGNMALTEKKWYGALYYKIVPAKINGQNYYTLLGFDSFSPYVSKKVIDVLYFNDDKAFIGAPVFNVSGKNVARMVFSFSARISMMLNYDNNIQTIVFDHLAPSETRYTGQPEFYGPDFSFDGFLYTKKFWQFIEDVKPNRPDIKPREKGSNKMR